VVVGNLTPTVYQVKKNKGVQTYALRPKPASISMKCANPQCHKIPRASAFHRSNSFVRTLQTRSFSGSKRGKVANFHQPRNTAASTLTQGTKLRGTGGTVAVEMQKEMARTCRVAHSALLRRVVGLRLQSSAVGWGCPSHWTRLPSLLSANMRLLSEIVYYTKPVEDVRSGLHNFTSRTCLLCAHTVQSEAVLQHITLDRNFCNRLRQARLHFLSETRRAWVRSNIEPALGACGPAGEGPI